MKNIIISGLCILLPLVMLSQVNTPDTVEVELARTSKVIFITQDSNDLKQLKQYDFQALFDDIIVQLEKKDTTPLPESTEPVPQPRENEDVTINNDDDDWEEDEENDDDDDKDHPHKHFPMSRQLFNAEFGINNYVETGDFQDANQSAYYSVHPWGSWYIALNTVNRVRFSEKFSLEAVLGINWYNFKFDADNSHITKTIDEVTFGPDPRDLDFIKSKLSMSYVNVS